jgi:hypothetical protein
MKLRDVENLDGFLEPDDLLRYSDSSGLRGPARWYAEAKAEAMRLRLMGRVYDAIQYETDCDKIYSTRLRGRVDW